MVTDETFRRPASLEDDDNPAVLYVRSYLLIRFAVGVIGLALPILLIVLEAWIIDGDVQIRGSLSAYYHTGVRDIFVGSLCVIGVLMITYMAAQRDTMDFRLSLAAGVAVLGVALLPTTRPNLVDASPRCGVTPMPEGCTALQQALGETLVAGIHFFCAAVFIAMLARLCFVFAGREERHTDHTGRVRALRICGWTIVGAIGWVVVGSMVDLTVWQLTPLYVGEVVSVWAFGTAWLLKGIDIWHRLPKLTARVASALRRRAAG